MAVDLVLFHHFFQPISTWGVVCNITHSRLYSGVVFSPSSTLSLLLCFVSLLSFDITVKNAVYLVYEFTVFQSTQPLTGICMNKHHNSFILFITYCVFCQVTIFGESAGAQSVSLHLMIQSSKPLFKQAVLQSLPFSIPLKTRWGTIGSGWYWLLMCDWFVPGYKVRIRGICTFLGSCCIQTLWERLQHADRQLQAEL